MDSTPRCTSTISTPVPTGRHACMPGRCMRVAPFEPIARTCRPPCCLRTSCCSDTNTRWPRRTSCPLLCGRTQTQCVLSNFHDPTVMGAVSRRVRVGGGAQQVAVPAVMADYQKFRMDQMVGYNIIQLQSKKWCRRIFHYLMMASAYNTYVVARDTHPETVEAEWPNCQDFLDQSVLWLAGEVRSRRGTLQRIHALPPVQADTHTTSPRCTRRTGRALSVH